MLHLGHALQLSEKCLETDGSSNTFLGRTMAYMLAAPVIDPWFYQSCSIILDPLLDSPFFEVCCFLADYTTSYNMLCMNRHLLVIARSPSQLAAPEKITPEFASKKLIICSLQCFLLLVSRRTRFAARLLDVCGNHG
jgi:hypothetical protein